MFGLCARVCAHVLEAAGAVRAYSCEELILGLLDEDNHILCAAVLIWATLHHFRPLFLNEKT